MLNPLLNCFNTTNIAHQILIARKKCNNIKKITKSTDYNNIKHLT